VKKNLNIGSYEAPNFMNTRKEPKGRKYNPMKTAGHTTEVRHAVQATQSCI